MFKSPHLKTPPSNSNGGSMGSPLLSVAALISKQDMIEVNVKNKDWSAKCRTGQRLR